MPKAELQLVIAVEASFYEQKKVQNIYTSDVGLKSVIFLLASCLQLIRGTSAEQ